jgi:MFS family permease
MGLGGSLFAPAWIFWLAAAQTIPALLCVFLTGPGGGPPSSDTGAAEGQREDETRLTWRGVKSIISDRRLLVFAACVLLFFVASAALGPGIAGHVTRLYPARATLIVAATMLLPQAIVAVISPWIGRRAQKSGRRPLLLFGWALVPLQAVLYAALPFVHALVICQILNGFSGAVFGVMMSVVVADLTAGTGRFNLTLGGLGVAIAAGASLSTFFAGLTIAVLGAKTALLGLAGVGVIGVLLLWIGLPETHPVPAMLRDQSKFSRMFRLGRPPAATEQ